MTESTALATLPHGRAITPGTPVAAFVPADFAQAQKMALVIAESGMAPKSYNSDPGKILVGMMCGAEVGLTPMQSLRGIAVIGNQPSLWGDVALAVIQASGLLEDMVETQEGAFVANGDGVAICTMKRKGRPTPVTRRYDMKRARTAGLLTKTGAWQVDPERMTQMRARAFCMRDLFADILSGLGIAEVEQDDFEHGNHSGARRETHIATVEQLEDQARPHATTPASVEGVGKIDGVVTERGAETFVAAGLATDGAVRATDELERSTAAATRASEDLIAREAERAATAAAAPKKRVRKPKDQPAVAETEPSENDVAESGAADDASQQADEPAATENVTDAEFEPVKETPTAEQIKLRKSYQSIRQSFDDDINAAERNRDLDAAAKARSNWKKYDEAIKALEAKYEFPADEPLSDAGESIYTTSEDGAPGYDLNAGDTVTATTLEGAIAELKKTETVDAAAAFDPEGLSDDDMMAFDSARGKHMAGLVAEAKRNR